MNGMQTPLEIKPLEQEIMGAYLYKKYVNTLKKDNLTSDASLSVMARRHVEDYEEEDETGDDEDDFAEDEDDELEADEFWEDDDDLADDDLDDEDEDD